ncbi:MAG: DUF5615 family PIN-like protein [Deltaproteobacteria bacterium]|nr:DUF5615 family PIN-like protein [Deltaproteobacteria bacterium]
MRLLADENVPGDAVEALRGDGHDVLCMRAEAPGTPDREVLARAVADARIVLNFDKDFGDLAFRARLPASAGVILVRLREPTSAELARIVATALRGRSDWPGHFAVIQPRRIRIRPLPA